MESVFVKSNLDPQRGSNQKQLLGVNSKHLSLDAPLDYHLPGGLKNYSTQKVLTYSYSSQKLSRKMFFVFMVPFRIWSQKWFKLPPKVTNFFSICRLGNFTHICIYAQQETGSGIEFSFYVSHIIN